MLLSQVLVAQTHECAATEGMFAAYDVTAGGCTKLPCRPTRRLKLERDDGRLTKQSRPPFHYFFGERTVVLADPVNGRAISLK